MSQRRFSRLSNSRPRQRPVNVAPRPQYGSGQFVPKTSRVSLRFGAQSDAKTPSIDLIHVSGNNVQDPLGTTGSGAPPGFSYWASMYERYRVIGSKCEAEWRLCTETKDTSTITTAARGILFPSNNTTMLASMSDYQSQPFAKCRSFTTAQPARAVSSMTSAKILGQKDVLGPDRLQSVINTGPADEWFWRITSATDNDVSTNTQICVSVTVTYDVLFFDRQPLDRPAISRFFDLAYLENVRYILAEKKKIEETRKQAQAKMMKKLELNSEKDVELQMFGDDPPVIVPPRYQTRNEPEPLLKSVRIINEKKKN